MNRYALLEHVHKTFKVLTRKYPKKQNTTFKDNQTKVLQLSFIALYSRKHVRACFFIIQNNLELILKKDGFFHSIAE